MFEWTRGWFEVKLCEVMGVQCVLSRCRRSSGFFLVIFLIFFFFYHKHFLSYFRKFVATTLFRPEFSPSSCPKFHIYLLFIIFFRIFKNNKKCDEKQC